MTYKWEDKIIYQIFPASYADANNDGFGDLKGITSKLDYLKWLGIDAIWLCPIYKTDFKDAGYDVIDYFTIWERFGTLEDFRELVREAKKRKIEIIMDIVLNHTSNEHAWFKKALADPSSQEHDYYIWSKNPSKTLSIFGGSAWEYVPQNKEYYFHLFAKEQVDLNWKNPQTIKAMVDIINFWYKEGVRGFRLDAIQHVDKEFSGDKVLWSFAKNMEKYLKAFIVEIKKECQDVFLIGEATGINAKRMVKYTASGMHLVDNFFNFSQWFVGWHHKTGRNGLNRDYQIKEFVNPGAIEIQQNPLIKQITTTNFLTSHDTSRALSRWGEVVYYWKESAKALAIFEFSLKGKVVIYYGEEIGMLNPNFTKRSDFRDVDAINSYHLFVDQTHTYTEKEMTAAHAYNGRDNSRTPMQWSRAINAGFNEGAKPWILIADNYLKINVQDQKKDPHSLLHWYRHLINFRKNSQYTKHFREASANLELLEKEIILITRTSKEFQSKTYLNLREHTRKIRLEKGKIILSSYDDEGFSFQKLRPYEAVCILIEREQND